MTTLSTGGPPTDHRGLAVLTAEQCLARLRSTPVGRLAFLAAGEIAVLPVNHAVADDHVVFRTTWGSKLRAAAAAKPVAYEADSWDPVTGTGWSVLLRGTAEQVDDPEAVARYDALGLRSWADREGVGVWVRLRSVEISGRELPPA